MSTLPNDHSTPSSNTSYATLVMCLCASFLFFKYVLQIFPSIITNQLMREFDLSGLGLGNLAATYYYSYMITQFFVGVLLDKFSTRWLVSSAILTCSLGSVLFAQTHDLFIAQIARAMMGVGVAFATVSYMKVASIWFEAHRYTFISTLLLTAAMAGAVFGESPSAFLVHQFGWRNFILYVGLCGIALTFLFALIVRDAPYSMNSINKRTPINFSDIISVIKNKQNWLLALYAGLAFSPTVIFGGLWGSPFLQEAYNLSKIQSSSIVSLIFIGLGVGSPLIAIISNHVSSRRNLMLGATFISTLALMLVLYFNTMPGWLVGLLLFIFGFGISSFMLVFSIGKESNPIALTATVIAMINASDAILDSITEPLIGKILDVFWDGKIIDGVHYFSVNSYHIALAVLPIYTLIACFILLRIKDSRS